LSKRVGLEENEVDSGEVESEKKVAREEEEKCFV
jgi:hypothetical protein